MLMCLQSPASSPPHNALAKSPLIARYISLYSMAKSLSALPDAGGLLDQRADIYAYFSVFNAAEAEYYDSLQG